MAFNVYLTFFQKYDAHQLRSLEPRYLVFCYGLPFIPALAFCFIRSDARGRVYGSAEVSGLNDKSLPSLTRASSFRYGVGYPLTGTSFALLRPTDLCGLPSSQLLPSTCRWEKWFSRGVGSFRTFLETRQVLPRADPDARLQGLPEQQRFLSRANLTNLPKIHSASMAGTTSHKCHHAQKVTPSSEASRQGALPEL
jgi:hypothetical protein